MSSEEWQEQKWEIAKIDVVVAMLVVVVVDVTDGAVIRIGWKTRTVPTAVTLLYGWSVPSVLRQCPVVDNPQNRFRAPSLVSVPSFCSYHPSIRNTPTRSIHSYVA